MQTLTYLHLAVMGVVFVVWAWHMMRLLMRLTRRSADRLAETGGGYFTWVGHSLSVFGEATRSDEDRALRRRLIWLGLVLMALVALGPVIAARGGTG